MSLLFHWLYLPAPFDAKFVCPSCRGQQTADFGLQCKIKAHREAYTKPEDISKTTLWVLLKAVLPYFLFRLTLRLTQYPHLHSKWKKSWESTHDRRPRKEKRLDAVAVGGTQDKLYSASTYKRQVNLEWIKKTHWTCPLMILPHNKQCKDTKIWQMVHRY